MTPNVGLVLVIAGMMTFGGLLALVAARLTGRHLADLNAAALALGESEQRQRLLIETMPQAIIFKDLDGVVLSANQSVRTQLGMRPRR